MDDKKKNLIAEDDKDIAATMAKGLETLGHTVVGITESGEDAIALADETTPELVIMDINLAGEFNGIETGGRLEGGQLCSASGDTRCPPASGQVT